MANAGKQAGFYSDFDPDSGSWSSPRSVTGAEFAKIRALIADYVTETQRQLDEFTRHRPGSAVTEMTGYWRGAGASPASEDHSP